ncbi:citrate transporter [Skermanella stibiiresistens SB22]|uniref:Citrate transporter n=1 Tax=Skermanella stibiiresistens SB22 TaxID=1385369 RepID=W9H376_9PROT|nr:SLC13 family permease [Skermanella stibiiresistens]EWY39162.1 citrate transporter [Skermanella stibiiresistens SB22]
MTWEQGALLVVLGATLGVFILDRWRFDIVAMAGLMTCVLAGIIRPEAAFAGFGNPAVITVAMVLIISRTLGRSGVVDEVAHRLTAGITSPAGHVAAVCGLGALLSAFMNNVGALALLMPIALSTAKRYGYSPAILLMPLSFATLLGGMTTLIGTPPNLLISTFRADATGNRFLMFDFLPIGLAVSVAGVAYLALVGWRLIPRERGVPRDDIDRFRVSDYVTEALVRPGSPWAGRKVAHLEAEHGAKVIGTIRDGRRVFARPGTVSFQSGDIVLLETDTATLRHLVELEGFALVAQGAGGRELVLTEAIVIPNALIQGSSALSLDLRQRWGVNLVAVSRQGRRFEGRLRDANLSAGDILLLDGDRDIVAEAMAELGCVPLADRKLEFEPQRSILAFPLFGISVAIAAFDLASAAVAFTCAVIAMLATRVIRLGTLYEGVDWPVITLLGAMIPLGTAVQTTGLADRIGDAVIMLAPQAGAFGMLVVVLLATMAVTPVLNNTATVVIMAPVVISIARQLGVSPDAFLMAVAIGASCDFLTPFGHHNNSIILGPGGYRFGDFWRVGLPLELIVIVLSLLIIPRVWGF